MLPDYLSVKIGKEYRIIGMPLPIPDDYPPTGLYGVCKWVNTKLWSFTKA